MSGGLMQLVAYGAQDVYLTGNPEMSYFTSIYKRHTNFSMEAIELSLSGSTNFGNKAVCQINRNGDLINRIYLKATISDQ